ncbi:ATP-binding cassette domain-containing protein [Levilactobacillus fujinensis]|uniref:ATP-binding cassette domain-containing protein n=1 Tax=Levilactobacillus fujinensis TaxID=2486024 RepID=A0ABW1THY9_9LACO|nr:ABC transporter ATP-binding protein [Levilactobacillus fujinensis]
MTVIGLFRTNRRRFSLIVGLIILSTIGMTLGSYVLTYAINGLKAGRIDLFAWNLVAMISSMLVGFGSDTLGSYLFSRQTQQYLHVIRERLVRGFLVSGNQSTAKMQNTLTNDLRILAADRAHSWLTLFTQSLGFVFYSVALLTFHWSLLVLVLVLTGIMLWVPRFLTARLQVATNRVSTSNNAYLESISRWLGGLAEIKRYAAQSKLFKVLQNTGHDLEDSTVHRTATISQLDIVNITFNVCSQLIILSFVGFLITQKMVMFGVIVSAGNFTSLIFGSVVQISNALGTAKSTQILSRQVQTQLDAVPEVKATADTTDLPIIQSIVGQGLCLKYATDEVITYPDFVIRRGEKILLTGDSGSGKTTLFKLILGELQPTQGSIRFLDKQGQPIERVPELFGYVPQESVLFPVTIGQNITMFDSKLDDQVPNIVRDVALDGDLAKMAAGIDTVVDLNNLNISGGQMQRIVLARAQIHDCQLLLIDEGTSAIDRANTLRALHSLLRKDNTVIFIAHHFDQSLVDLFDRTIQLSK